MSSLEAVNKTLGRIEEDTDQLNRNFEKWFLAQQRGKLDAEEDRRERKKLFAMLGAAGAAGAGRAGAGKPSGGMNPLGFLNNLPPWAKLLLGVYAGKMAVKAFNLATGKPFKKAGEKLGQKTMDVAAEYNRYAQSRNEARLLELNKQLQAAAEIRGDVDASILSTEATALQSDISSDTFEVSTPQTTAPTISAPPAKPQAASVDLGGVSFETASPPKPELAQAVQDIRNIKVIDDGKTVKYIEKGRGFISPDEAVRRLSAAGFDAKGNPIPLLSAPEAEAFTVDTSAPEQPKVKAADPNIKTGTKLAIGFGLLDAFDFANQYQANTFGPASVFNDNTATGGKATAEIAATAATAVGELFDFGTALWMAGGGQGSQTNIGLTMGEKVRETDWYKRVSKEGGEVTLNPVVRGTVETLGGFSEEAVQSVIDGVKILSGTATAQEINQQNLKDQIERGKAQGDLFYELGLAKSDNPAIQAAMDAAILQTQAAIALNEAASTLSSGASGSNSSGQSMILPFQPTIDINHSKIEQGIAGMGFPTLGTLGVK